MNTAPSKPIPIKARRAITELVGAGAIWGFGFIATIFALRDMGPLTTIVVRFVAAVVLTVPFFFFVSSLKKTDHRNELRLAFWPGMMLALLMIFQTWGLKYTTATKSSFITTLYIVFVPMMESLFYRRKIAVSHYLFVFVALIGTALICNFQGGDWNIGDFLTFACTLCASLHIIMIGQVSHRIGSSLVFNTYQSFWAIWVPVALLAFMPEDIHRPWSPVGWFGIGWLVFGSTILAFMLQVRAQKVLSPSLASLLFMLESPFAALFAFFALGDRMSLSQWIGALLIVAAAIGVVRTEAKPKST
jgi:drug/metabolite transporter (DMT)-like permease